LIFEPTEADGAPVDQAYGDRVTAASQGGFNYGVAGGFTPNVLVDYGTLNGGLIGRWAAQYGDLSNVIWTGTNSFDLRLVADAGYLVTLGSFDMAGWPNTDYTIPSLQVRDGDGNVLFDQPNALIQGDGTGPGHSTFTFTTPLSASTLLIFFDPGMAGSNVGMDNVQFGELQVPEPRAFVLIVAAGGVALLLRARRAWLASRG
jgi:hypothetical protein